MNTTDVDTLRVVHEDRLALHFNKVPAKGKPTFLVGDANVVPGVNDMTLSRKRQLITPGSKDGERELHMRFRTLTGTVDAQAHLNHMAAPLPTTWEMPGMGCTLGPYAC